MFAYCNNNPIMYIDAAGCYAISVPTLAKGLNLPNGAGAPVEIGGEVLYYYSIVNRGGYLYEYWYDANGNLIWIRHHTDHNQPQKHENPHDHRGKKDKDGYNTEDSTPLPPNNKYHPPKNVTIVPADLGKNVTTVATGVVVGYTLYQVIKWAVASVLAPETGGLSYAFAGLLP